jgi:hypothetical protein
VLEIMNAHLWEIRPAASFLPRSVVDGLDRSILRLLSVLPDLRVDEDVLGMPAALPVDNCLATLFRTTSRSAPFFTLSPAARQTTLMGSMRGC